MEVTFCELRAKEVVNVYDGKRLGNIIDMVIDTTCARVLGIIVPNDRSLFNIFKCNTDIFIPYNRICKIGKDVILVELYYQTNNKTRVLSGDYKNAAANENVVENEEANSNYCNTK